MKRNTKIAAGALIAAMVLTLVGCGDNKTQSTASGAAKASSTVSSGAKLKSFSLPYTTVVSFNPLLPSSNVNMQLWPLMYDCLAEPDATYKPTMQLAKDIQCNGTTVTINLKNGVLFTNGTSLSGRDVEYSLDFARKNQASPYFARLSNISAISSNGLTVRITLKSPDPLFANLLDIPIIKEGSDTKGDAVGTGRYTLAKNGVNGQLNLNKKWYKGASSPFPVIELVNIPYADAVMSSLAIGEVNYAYSDSGSGTSASATNTDSAAVNLNQLVFVGVNTNKDHLNNAHFRRALSLSLNRKLLVSQIFSNRALASVLPFNPKWSQLSAPTEKEIAADFAAETTEMSLAGGTGSGTAFTLLVNQENTVRTAAARYVASCFAKTGIAVNVKPVPFAQYDAAVKSGNFDLYIGELKLSNNMDLSPFFTPGGAAAYNAVSNSTAWNTFNAWRAGTQDIKAAAQAFTAETPFIPLCFRTGSTSYTRGLSGVTPMDGNIFYGFESWKNK